MGEKIDVLNRNDFICKLESIVEMLSENQQSCCFGIDGVWGSGKSFVLDKFENELRRMKVTQSEEDKYFVFHYDCWKYDYYDEPLIAIVSAMIDSIDKELNKIPADIREKGGLAIQSAKNTVVRIAGELCKNKIGIDLVDVAGKTLENHDKKKESEFDQFYGFNRALEETRNGMQKIAKDKTTIIVVDELDRCLPEYAIRVLERLHHVFFDIENVIVIISVDKTQLEHSIKGIYGNEIDIEKYLRKYISFVVELNNGIASSYATKYDSYFEMFDIAEGDSDTIEEFLSQIMMGLDIRTQEGIMRKAEIIHKIINGEKVRDCSLLTFEVMYVTLSLKMKTKDLAWVSKIWSTTYSGPEKTLGTTYYNKLKEYGLIVKNSAMVANEYGNLAIREGIISKTFYWMNCLHVEPKFGNSEPYYYMYEDCALEVVNRFKNIVNIVNCY